MTACLALLTALCAVAAADAGEEPPPRPNIILCMADDQGFGDVGYYGNPIPKTPNLDKMAAAGLRFDRFNAGAPVCSPTRGSVMTGRTPNRFGCFAWGYELRPEEFTVAKALKSAGYATGHFGKWHLGSVRANGPNNPGASGFDTWLSALNYYDNDPILSREGKAVALRGEGSMIAVDAALEFIKSASDRDQPFLAVIWFGSPHNPHTATKKNRALYKDLPKAQREYYGEITGIDSAMGRLRQALRDLKIDQNTLVWYTSDNGPQGPEGKGEGSTGGLRGRKGTVWEGGLRVPTIVEWPAAIPEPRVTAVPSGTVDILPTLLDLTGAALPAPDRPLDGASLAPLIQGNDEFSRPAMGFWSYPAPGRSTPSAEIMAKLLEAQQAGLTPPPEFPPPPTKPAARLLATFEGGDELPGHAAWIDGRFKLHRVAAEDGSISYQLYDLVADPAETTDLADKEADRVALMTAALADWQASVVRSLRGDDYQKTPRP